MPILNAISDVQINNLALSRIGSVSGISSLDTTADTSVEAQQCALWYAQNRDALLTDFPWPWARSAANLAQVNTSYPASPEWQYSYRYPSDCLNASKVIPTPVSVTGTSPPQTTGLGVLPNTGIDQWWLRPVGDAQPWSFEVQSDATGRLIMTGLGPATLLYTRAVNDPAQYSADFVDLLAWRQAASLAFAIAISDARRDMALKMYKQMLMRTRARMANEAQSDIPARWPNSEFVRSRWGG